MTTTPDQTAAPSRFLYWHVTCPESGDVGILYKGKADTPEIAAEVAAKYAAGPPPQFECLRDKGVFHPIRMITAEEHARLAADLADDEIAVELTP